MSVINIEMGLNKTEFNSSAHRSQFQKTMKYKKPTCTKITFIWSLPTEGLFVSNCVSCLGPRFLRKSVPACYFGTYGSIPSSN